MTDVHDKQTRSRNMAAVKAKNTKPEIWLRKQLFAKGFRYQLHRKDLPGKPDLYLPRYKTAIFINGCFWHAHRCSNFVLPKTRISFWTEKLRGNVKRDRDNIIKLVNSGHRVLIVWECAINGKEHLPDNMVITLISAWLKSTAVAGSIQSCGLTYIDDIETADELSGFIPDNQN